MVPIVRAELIVDYGRERRVIGATDHPLYCRSLANTLSGEALNTAEALDGIDDDLVTEARAEAHRLRRLIAELLPDATCLGELEDLDLM